MCLERSIGSMRTNESYSIETREGIGDWEPLIEELLRDKEAGVEVARMAAKFHNGLARWILAVAQLVQCRNVVLSGGVFQNAYLTERSRWLLAEHGYRVFTHYQVPPNDGGIALGQVVLAGAVKV